MSFFNKRIKSFFNEIIFPLKLIIPQPIVKKIPYLVTNEEIRIEKVLKYIKGKCLDIGCGENKLIKKYRAGARKGIGIDVYPWDGVDMVVRDSSNLSFPDKSFDTITFVASINHIPNRHNVLIEAHRLLKDNGVVIITNLTPFVSKIWHSIAFWDRDQKERGMKDGEVFGFTCRELCLLLKGAGFKVIKRKKFSWGINNLYICTKIKLEKENNNYKK